MIFLRQIPQVFLLCIFTISIQRCAFENKPEGKIAENQNQNEVVADAPPKDPLATPVPVALEPVLSPAIAPALPVAPIFPSFGGGANFRRGGYSHDHDDHDKKQCKKDRDCENNNPCATSSCVDNFCVNTPIPGCAYCETADQCSAGPLCTEAMCSLDNRCEYITIPGCPTLLSIIVLPADETIANNTTLQYTALGLFSDSSTVDITNTVIWSSSNNSIATISNIIGSLGLATGVAPGAVIITATLGLIQGTTNLNVQQAFAYITNYDNNTVSRCSITSTNNLTSCVNAGASLLTQPHENPINNARTFMFIVNHTGPVPITRCNLNYATGVLSTCVNSGATGTALPKGLVFNSIETRAYITNAANNTVSLCNLNSVTGVISGCADSLATLLNNPGRIALNEINQVAYISSQNSDQIIQCAINASGQLVSCFNTGVLGTDQPTGITINASNTIAYIASALNDSIVSCAIDPLTGNLGACTSIANAIFNGPDQMAINFLGNIIYITSQFGDTVIACDLDNTGALTTCITTSAAPLGNPIGITLLY